MAPLKLPGVDNHTHTTQHNKTGILPASVSIKPDISAYANTLPEVFSSSVHAVVSLALVSVIWFTLAPIFGLTVFGTRRSSTADYYGPNHYPYSSSASGSYYDYSDPGYQYESPYYAQGRSLNLGDDEKGGALARIGRVMNRSGS